MLITCRLSPNILIICNFSTGHSEFWLLDSDYLGNNTFFLNLSTSDKYLYIGMKNKPEREISGRQLHIMGLKILKKGKTP